jgi:hypothetical protein
MRVSLGEPDTNKLHDMFLRASVEVTAGQTNTRAEFEDLITEIAKQLAGLIGSVKAVRFQSIAKLALVPTDQIRLRENPARTR